MRVPQGAVCVLETNGDVGQRDAGALAHAFDIRSRQIAVEINAQDTTHRLVCFGVWRIKTKQLAGVRCGLDRGLVLPDLKALSARNFGQKEVQDRMLIGNEPGTPDAGTNCGFALHRLGLPLRKRVRERQRHLVLVKKPGVTVGMPHQLNIRPPGRVVPPRRLNGLTGLQARLCGHKARSRIRLRGAVVSPVRAPLGGLASLGGSTAVSLVLCGPIGRVRRCLWWARQRRSEAARIGFCLCGRLTDQPCTLVVGV
jgi:hypothetical protein